MVLLRQPLYAYVAQTAFRESYRIVGETIITVDDYTSGRVFDDAICYAAALAVRKKSTLLKVPLKEIKETLVKNGVIVPDYEKGKKAIN